jgi:Flp pilus assembly protein TadG
MKSGNRERGQAMVEVALLLVVLLAALIGIMDWSWTMFTHESLVSRASMAARWGAVHSYSSSAVQDMVLYGVTPCAGCTAAFGLSASNVNVSLVPINYTAPDDNGVNITTCQIVVTISGYTVNHFTPVLTSSISGRPITASYVYENPDGSSTTCTAP